MLVARKASCHVANAFLTRLKLIWPRSSLKTTKMSKERIFLQKAPGVNGLMRLRKSQNIAGEEQLQNCFFFDRGKDMAINYILNTDRQFNAGFKISDNQMVKHSIASNLITSRENALYSVYVASSNSQFQNQRATKGFILIRHKR